MKVKRIVRPLEMERGPWVSADGLSEPIYILDEDSLEYWYGCGAEHRDYEHGCCHGRPGDDRST